MEFGIFNDEGKIEGGMFSRAEAEARMAEGYTSEDEVHIGECCHDHPEHEREGCEECPADDAEDESDE